jgi:TolB protein
LSDRQLTWYGRAGEVLGTVGEPGDYKGLALSPDGTRLAASKGSDPTANIWLLDLAHDGAATRFTFSSSGSDRNPVWSPDGRDIIFTSDRDGGINLYRKPASGAQDEELMLRSAEKITATSWSPDKHFLLFDLVSPKTQIDIWVLPLEGERKPVSFQATQALDAQARVSPLCQHD